MPRRDQLADDRFERFAIDEQCSQDAGHGAEQKPAPEHRAVGGSLLRGRDAREACGAIDEHAPKRHDTKHGQSASHETKQQHDQRMDACSRFACSGTYVMAGSDGMFSGRYSGARGPTKLYLTICQKAATPSFQPIFFPSAYVRPE